LAATKQLHRFPAFGAAVGRGAEIVAAVGAEAADAAADVGEGADGFEVLLKPAKCNA
jgi:hypothetical protein